MPKKGAGFHKARKKAFFLEGSLRKARGKKKEPRKEEKLTYPVPYGAIFRFPLSHQVI